MKRNVGQPSKEKTSHTSGKGCWKLIMYIMILGAVTIPLLIICVIYIQVIILTTPGRNRDIGTLPDMAYEEVTLTTADGVTISGWYVVGTQPNAIVIVHGIHANRAYLIPQAVLLAEAGYHLLLIDLRGLGQSEDSMMTFGYREALDVQAAIDYLVALPNVERVGALGHSLGAAAVVRAAATDQRLQGLVLQSTYSSLSQAVNDSFNNFVILPKWPFAPLVISLAQFRTELDIGQVDSARDLATMPPRPILIIHGKGDNVFPFHHAQIMFDSAQEPKTLWIVDNLAGHINPIDGHELEYEQRVLAFFEDSFSTKE